MSSVVISGDTSGAITLQAPAVSGNTTLNLPASSGTVLTQNSSAPANSFVVDASGNVGIGTSSPSGKLHIYGTGSTLRPLLQGTTNQVDWSINNTSGQLYIGIDGSSGGTTGTSYGAYIYNQANTPLTFSTNAIERMRINSSGIVTMPFQPAFLATGSSSNTTYTASSIIVFGTLNSTFVSSNRSSGYNTSTSTYTAPVAGLYQFYAQFYTSSNPTSIAWWKNGSQMSWNDAALVTFNATGVNNLVNGSAIIELAAGDTINVRVRTGNANVIIYGGHSAFWGYLIG